MIEGRPRESLVQYENPIEVCTIFKDNSIYNYRSQLVKIPRIHSRRPLDVSYDTNNKYNAINLKC